MENTKASPKEFFLYLLSNVALYYCASWLVSLLYDYINYSFGSMNLYDTSWLPSSMRWAIASLVIVFPLYLWMTRTLNREVDAEPAKRGLWVRRWLMYVTLALASIALVVDLVALVNQFLSGEFATTFFLKVGAVALVAGIVFFYYLTELRRDAGKTVVGRSLFQYLSIGVIVVAIVGGFMLVGSPSDARARRYDDRRLTDLQDIQWRIVNFWQNSGTLPASLSDIEDPLSNYLLPRDPMTKEMYQYTQKSAKSFALCATFDRESAGTTRAPAPALNVYETKEFSNWMHGAGKVCFDRSINEQLYPMNKK